MIRCFPRALPRVALAALCLIPFAGDGANACDPVPTAVDSLREQEMKLREQLTQIQKRLDELQARLGDVRRRAPMARAAGGMVLGVPARPAAPPAPRPAWIELKAQPDSKSGGVATWSVTPVPIEARGIDLRHSRADALTKKMVRRILRVEHQQPIIFLDFLGDEATEQRVLRAIRGAMGAPHPLPAHPAPPPGIHLQWEGDPTTLLPTDAAGGVAILAADGLQGLVAGQPGPVLQATGEVIVEIDGDAATLSGDEIVIRSMDVGGDGACRAVITCDSLQACDAPKLDAVLKSLETACSTEASCASTTACGSAPVLAPKSCGTAAPCGGATTCETTVKVEACAKECGTSCESTKCESSCTKEAAPAKQAAPSVEVFF
ncbi:MAG: hypothetical protein KDC38_04855 [Planctomycetes bacterium]|nr:hypothetical protein [Planctomycetota bacterium]